MRRALFLTLLGLAAAPAAAQGPTLGIELYPGETGWIGLRLSGVPGETVHVSEDGQPLGGYPLDSAGRHERSQLTTWRCDRRERTMVAATDDGRRATGTLTTPACDTRLRLTLRPKRPRAGRPVTVVLRDTWGLGDLRPRVCVRGAGAGDCDRLRFTGRRAAMRAVPRRTGRLRASARVPGVEPWTRRARVRPGRGGLKVLATGDSMIQLVDHALKRRLERGRTRVRSDARISTGISKPSMLNWMAHAGRQARGIRPDATVVFLGANDGFPIGGADCCGEAWVRGYAARVGRMMRAYARGGRGAVYWMLLPAPRPANWRPIYRAVNRAIRRAARRHPGEARVVDLVRTFTPGFAFRQSIRWRGRIVSVRQSDGVHLNPAGASIAAALAIRAMRRDGVL